MIKNYVENICNENKKIKNIHIEWIEWIRNRLYGSETWTTKKFDKNNIGKFWDISGVETE